MDEEWNNLIERSVGNGNYSIGKVSTPHNKEPSMKSNLTKLLIGCITICIVPVAILVLYEFLRPAPPNLMWDKLFIDQNVFPTGWERGNVYEDCISAPLNSGCDNYQEKGIGFSFSNVYLPRAGEDIRYYMNKAIATKDFDSEKNMLFSLSPNETKYFTPTELNYLSPIASQTYTACNQIRDNWKVCRFIGQYSNFHVELSLFDKNEIDYTLFIQLLKAIDQKMEMYKDNPPLVKN